VARFCIGFVLACWGCFGLSATAQTEVAPASPPPALTGQQEADQYLRAFKQRALDAAFESGARVKSVSYIDNEGRLHERAMFSSEADVRGVQIESYLDAMGGEKTLDAVRVSEEARCQLWTGSGSNSGLISVKIDAGPAAEVSEQAITQEQERMLAAALVTSLGNSGFRVLDPIGPKPKSYQDTTYARALVGDWSDGPAADFAVTVRVARIPDDRQKKTLYINHPGLSSLFYAYSSTSKSVDFNVSVSFSQPASQSDMGDYRAIIETGAFRALETGEWVLDQDEDDLTDWVSDITEEFVATTKCLPRVFRVTRDGPQKYSIDAGQSRGVTEGSWLLVGDRALMVENVVSDLTLDSLLMLKVTRANDYRAQAEPLPSGEGALVSQGELLGTLP
jgi:hypothetical protein